MGWDVDKLRYTYTEGELRAVARRYWSLYHWEFCNPMRDLLTMAIAKADFDISLSAIGKGDWRGIQDTDFMDYDYYHRLRYFRRYRHFGKAQQVVIANILGITDMELSKLGFYQIPQLRGKAYSWMTRFLNGSYGRAEVHS